MKCQTLYNLRDKYEFCSGQELHQFFTQHTGEPSPKGSKEIDKGAALDFIARSLASVAWNSGGEFGTAANTAVQMSDGLSRPDALTIINLLKVV